MASETVCRVGEGLIEELQSTPAPSATPTNSPDACSGDRGGNGGGELRPEVGVPGPTFSVYYRPPNDGFDFGHVFVEVHDETGNSEVLDYYPAAEGSPFGEGTYGDPDGGRRRHHQRVDVALTPERARLMIASARGLKAAGVDYSVVDNNCVTRSGDVLAAGGFDRNLLGRPTTPWEFWNAVSRPCREGVLSCTQIRP